MCGNSIRCVGKYLYDNKIVDKLKMTIETMSGIKELELTKKNGKADTIRVNMGKAVLDPKLIPVNLPGDKVLNQKVEVADGEYSINCVSLGNPHCVVFTENVEKLDVGSIGPKFENDKLFPERVNTEFAKIIDGNTIMMRAWERGSGETMECGTGACAVVVSAVENGYCKKNEEIRIKLPKGEISVCYTDDGTVYLTGNAVKVFDGTIEL